MKYVVTLRFQYPAWDEKDGITFEVCADSKRAAVNSARLLAEYDGHIPATGKGRVTMHAEAR